MSIYGIDDEFIAGLMHCEGTPSGLGMFEDLEVDGEYIKLEVHVRLLKVSHGLNAFMDNPRTFIVNFEHVPKFKLAITWVSPLMGQDHLWDLTIADDCGKTGVQVFMLDTCDMDGQRVNTEHETRVVRQWNVDNNVYDNQLGRFAASFNALTWRQTPQWKFAIP